MKKIFAILTLLLIASVSFSRNKIDNYSLTQKSQIQANQIDSLMEFCFSNGMFNGTILVTKNNKIVYKKALGYADVERKKVVGFKTVFNIASVSKQFTAMGIMILKEEGKLSFEDTVAKFFPKFPDEAQKITVRQLLNHTSGISDRSYYKLQAEVDYAGNKDVFKLINKSETYEFKPSERFLYSNIGYVLLASIIEKQSGMAIDVFFEKEIFKPLKMNRTTANKRKLRKFSRQATGYSPIGSKVVYKSNIVGSGGIYSTVEDLSKWNKALNSQRLVSKKSLQEAFKTGSTDKGAISINLAGQKVGYGFGWITIEKNGNKYVQHDGSIPGFRSFIKKNLTTGYDYIFLTNNGQALAMNEITEALDNILENTVYEQPKIPIVNKIIKEFKNNNISTAMENVKTAIKNSPDNYIVEERVVNRFGYLYLRADKVKKAIAVLELNANLFPKSWNAFDSLAEAYYVDKQFKISEKHYQKSLELNSKNTNAKTMLQKIASMRK